MSSISIQNMQEGDILLTSTRFRGVKDLSSAAIRLVNFMRYGFNRRDWTHVAVYIGDGKIVEAMPGEMIKPKSLEQTYLTREDCTIKLVRRLEVSAEKRKKIADACKSLGNEKSYDFTALLYFLIANILPKDHKLLEAENLGNAFNAEDKYFCSELVAEGLRQAEIYCFEKEPHQIMPAQFDDPESFVTIGVQNATDISFAKKHCPEWLKKSAYFLSTCTWVVFITLCATYAQQIKRRIKQPKTK